MPKMPIRQEKVLSSEFHMAMLRNLEIHHDEHSSDWSLTEPLEMVDRAAQHIVLFMNTAERKHLVHSANYLSIAWAILGLQLSDGERALIDALGLGDSLEKLRAPDGT